MYIEKYTDQEAINEQGVNELAKGIINTNGFGKKVRGLYSKNSYPKKTNLAKVIKGLYQNDGDFKKVVDDLTEARGYELKYNLGPSKNTTSLALGEIGLPKQMLELINEIASFVAQEIKKTDPSPSQELIDQLPS